jgi:hypothetical protein
MAWVLSYLTVNHLYRMYTNFGGFDLDISTFTMLQVCKLSALAFCYRDGGVDPKDLTKDQKERVVDKLPSIIEICSYTQFVSNCALGVFFEFSDYKRFIQREKEYAYGMPSPILPSLKSLATAIGCTAFFIVASQYFWIEYIFSPEYSSHSLLYKVYYFYVAMSIKRFFYYGPFNFTTGAFQAAGLGYNGNEKWDKVIGV